MTKSVIYTAHTLQRMSLRGISKEMIEEAIRNPDRAGSGYKGMTLAYKAYADKRIKVVYTGHDTNNGNFLFNTF